MVWWVWAWPFTIDDAYISARYAQHWVAGHGLVFNIGERVEGFSNFTWVSVLAVAQWAGAPLEPALKVLGLIAAAATALGMCALLVRRLGVRTRWVLVGAGLWLGADPAFAVWTLAGLETPLFAALLVWSLYVWLTAEPPGRGFTPTLAALLSVLAWTRPEGPAIAVGLLVLTPVYFKAGAARRARLTASAIALGIVVCGFVLRRWYYDAWWPNPYYVKLGGGVAQIREGLGYWGAALAHHGGPALLAWLLLPLFYRARDAGVRRSQRVLTLVWCAYSLFIIRSGREPFPFHRFYMPLVPLAICIGAPLLAEASSRARLAIAAFLAVVCAGAAPLTAGGHWDHVAQLSAITRDISLPFGRWIRSTPEFPSTLGVFWAGAMPYAAGPDVHTLDMGGLCDRRIARVPLPWRERNHGHTKHDFAYVLDRAPTYVTDDALHTLDALVSLGGEGAAAYAEQRAALLAAYTRLNDHLFVRVQPDTRARMERFVHDFPEDAAARAALDAYRAPTPGDP